MRTGGCISPTVAWVAALLATEHQHKKDKGTMAPPTPSLNTDAPLKAGDSVQLKRPESLYADLRKRVEGRNAVVVRTYTRLGSDEATVVVRFLKKSPRGKDFEEHFPKSLLILVEAP